MIIIMKNGIMIIIMENGIMMIIKMTILMIFIKIIIMITIKLISNQYNEKYSKKIKLERKNDIRNIIKKKN